MQDGSPLHGCPLRDWFQNISQPHDLAFWQDLVRAKPAPHDALPNGPVTQSTDQLTSLKIPCGVAHSSTCTGRWVSGCRTWPPASSHLGGRLSEPVPPGSHLLIPLEKSGTGTLSILMFPWPGKSSRWPLPSQRESSKTEKPR